jgi:hypothetical protein
MIAAALIFAAPREADASTIELTARPTTGDTVYWSQLGTPNLLLTSPQSFTYAGGIAGSVCFNGLGTLMEQCCIGITGTFNGDFAPGDVVLETNFSR